MSEAPKIDAKLVKELREKSGAPMGDCLKALQEAKGDMEEAFVVLRKRGMASAAKKASRSTNEGAVGTYIHAGGKIGVLLELNCESDFVARTDDFQELLKDIAMHIAAVDPRYVGKDEVTPEAIEKEKEIYRAQARAIIEATLELRREGVNAMPEIMLPLILFPISIPALLAMVDSTTSILTGDASPDFWIKMQVQRDLWLAQKARSPKVRPFPRLAARSASAI